jgi:diacylglycerol O-acyltransferase / wax synthase
MSKSAEEDLAELSEWGNEPELNPLDALMWRTERPPANSWTGVVVQILDSVPDWNRLFEAYQWGLQIVPRFMEKVVEPVIPVGPPVWTRDPNFDLSYHLRRVALPAPGTMKQLLELAQAQAVVPLDRNRPPWTAMLVEGLEGGRAAYVLQAHHVLMDGAGATQLFARILGVQRESRGIAAPDHATGREAFTPLQATARDISRMIKGLPAVANRVGAVVADAAARPGHAARYARSAARVVAPKTPPVPGALTGGPRTAWRFGMLECELKDLKKAGAAAGGTVNDAFVSAILGGLREYFKSQGEELPDIPISMPVSVRTAKDDMGGNRFAGAFFAAPAGIDDPAARIQAMRARVSAVRDEPALDFMGVFTPLFNYAPSPLVTSAIQQMAGAAVVTTSSWPGLTEPAYVAGARMDRMFVFGPLPGTSMCASLCSHVGTCCIAINVDGATYPNIESLWSAMQQGLDQVLALGEV